MAKDKETAMIELGNIKPCIWNTDAMYTWFGAVKLVANILGENPDEFLKWISENE